MSIRRNKFGSGDGVKAEVTTQQETIIGGNEGCVGQVDDAFLYT